MGYSFDANFIVIGGTAGCGYHNLRRTFWAPSDHKVGIMKILFFGGFLLQQFWLHVVHSSNYALCYVLLWLENVDFARLLHGYFTGTGAMKALNDMGN